MEQKNVMTGFADVLNRHSAENGSDTPDFILAEYLEKCLWAYDTTVTAREKWFGRGKDKE